MRPLAILAVCALLLACEGVVGSTGRAPGDPPPDLVDAGRPGPRPDAGADAAAPDPRPDSSVGPAVDASPDPEPDAGPPPDPGDPMGECTGTAAECEAARVVNEYRTSHMNTGECNNPLRWDDHLGQLAHEHQSGPFVGHSSHGYIEVVGQAYGVRETAEYIMQWEPVIEEHCSPDGSYIASHHCATMFCNNYTIGIGVYEGGGATYMTIMFGDERGMPGW